MANENLIPHPSENVIRKSEDYVVDGIGKVTVLTALDAAKATAANQPEVIYSAYAILGAQVGGQIRPFPVEWIMENVTSVENAFELFQEQAVATLKANMAEAHKRAEEEQRKIIAAPPGLKIR